MHFVWKEWRHDYWFVWTTSILFNQINCHVKIISFLFTMIAMFRDVFYWLYKANILQTMHGKIIFSAWNRIKKNLSSISGVAVSKKSGRSFIVIWELVPIQLQLVTDSEKSVCGYWAWSFEPQKWLRYRLESDQNFHYQILALDLGFRLPESRLHHWTIILVS